MTDDLGKVLEALAFAAYQHRKQKRKGSEETPYINHPIDVARQVVCVGGITDTTTVLSAILHDTVEDTDTRFDELEKRFGKAVTDIVRELTDDKSLPPDERKALQITEAHKKSVIARAVKLADKTCNVREIGVDPPTDWSTDRRLKYFDWAGAVVAGLRGMHPALEAAFDAELAKSRQSLIER